MVFPELHSSSHIKGSKTVHVILSAIICMGVGLAVFQYIYNRSLWLDEAVLALSLITRDFTQLIQPLGFSQVAPIGFLFAERLSIAFFGKGEMALRVFPFLCFLFAIPSYYLLLNKLPLNKTIVLLATSVFSITLSLLRYSSEMKQYSSDVFISILIFYFTLKLQFDQKKDLILYSLTGIVAVWISNVAIIVLFVSGVYVLFTKGYLQQRLIVALPILFWVISFGLYYLKFIHQHPSTDLMMEYWGNAFLPLNPFSNEFYAFVYASLKAIYSWLMGFGPLWLFPFSVSLVGIWFLIKQKHFTLSYFLFAPILCHLVLSALKMYPFSDRLILYLAPQFLLLFCIGAWVLFELVDKNIKSLPPLSMITPALLFFFPLALRYPIRKEEIKGSLHFMQENIKKDEPIYIYYSADMAYNYYTETKMFHFDNPVFYGEKYRENYQKYVEEISVYKGHVWLLFSHVYPFDSKQDNEETFIINTLENTDNKVISQFKGYGSSVYLVDIK